MTMTTPLGWLARRYTLSPRVLRWATTFSLVVAILIVLGGGIVRVTSSGLGCPTWPVCEAGSLTPTPALGIHGVIEFTNRMLTTVLCIAVACVIVAARLQKPRVRAMTRLAWSQFWLVVANAVAGGITVLTQLNPWMVALHFIMAMALLTTTALTWHRAREASAPRAIETTSRITRTTASALIALTGVLVIAGTLVSGSGPHSGDSDAGLTPRMPLDWSVVATVHGILGALVLVLAIALWMLDTRDGARVARRRTTAFIVVVLAQGLIGVVQAFTGLPDALVALHLLGAALVWVGALRVLLDTNPQLFPSVRVGLPSAVAERHDATSVSSAAS